MTPDGTSNVTFAVSELYLGDTDPDGTPDTANGWMHYGYNIDGVAPSDLGAFCQPVNGASPQIVHEEGPQGQENAWGHLFLPLLLETESDTSAQVNMEIAQGSFTYLFTLDDLGAGATYNPLVAQYAGGADLGGIPKFDGTDVWPPVQGTTVAFAASYLTSNTWVSGAPTATLSLNGIGSSTASITLNITHAVVTMPLDAAHQTVKGGMISGVISTADLQAQIQAVAGAISPALCSGATIAVHPLRGRAGVRHPARRHAGPDQDLRRHLDRARLRRGPCPARDARRAPPSSDQPLRRRRLIRAVIPPREGLARHAHSVAAMRTEQTRAIRGLFGLFPPSEGKRELDVRDELHRALGPRAQRVT